MNSVGRLIALAEKKYQGRICYSDERRSLSFCELKIESYNIASALIMKAIFKKPIAIFMDKSVECISAIMGVICSGNFYTPIDTRMPETRVKIILETLSPALIISDASSQEKIRDIAPTAEILLYEDIIKEEGIEDLVVKHMSMTIDTDILYVLFTSGSTGIPKGVTISQRAVQNYIDWISHRFGINEATVLGNEAPLYFDLSIQDVYAPLFTGCKTVLTDKSKFSFPSSLMKYLCDAGVNTIFWVPSALCAVANLRGLDSKYKPNFEKILFCGEVMPVKQLNMWRQRYPKAMFVNLYGPTEACDACAYYVIDRDFRDDEKLPIGFPAENTDIFLLDENDEQILKRDITGEICIRGSALADGYYNAPEKTRECFIQNPLNDKYDELIYRTGDMAYYNEREELVYVSRKDYQIKHMGHRIELGEIEVAANAAEGVCEACCVYNDDDDRIVLYYSGLDYGNKIKEILASRLPHYMIPGKYVFLRKLPHNANGKIDRNALKTEGYDDAV